MALEHPTSFVYSTASLMRAIHAQTKEYLYQIRPLKKVKIRKSVSSLSNWNPIFIYKSNNFAFFQINPYEWRIFLLGTEIHRLTRISGERKYWLGSSIRILDTLDHMLVESIHNV